MEELFLILEVCVGHKIIRDVIQNTNSVPLKPDTINTRYHLTKSTKM